MSFFVSAAKIQGLVNNKKEKNEKNKLSLEHLDVKANPILDEGREGRERWLFGRDRTTDTYRCFSLKI